MSTGVQETHRIATPEGVSLELSLAGLGSRFVALLVDVFLMGLVLAVVVVLRIRAVCTRVNVAKTNSTRSRIERMIGRLDLTC